MPLWRQLVWLALAGALGTLARYGLSGLAQRLASDWFPVGTLVVNVVGCALFGLIWSLAEERLLISGATRFILLTGFMGAFTTFSTFAFETTGFLRDAQWWPAVANLVLQNALGLLAVVVGFSLGRLV